MRTSPDIVQAFVKVIELKDLSTAAHTWRVVLYTRALAEAGGVDHAEIERLTLAAALHDVGKIDVPDEILQKPGALSEDERTLMEAHPVLGHERLVRMGEDDHFALDLVRHHHERMDGLGYPDRLRGEHVPRAARYFSVIDSFDAMTSLRPYRQEIGPEAARHAMDQLREGIGTRYCEECVTLFTDLYETGKLGWILHYYNDHCEVPSFAHDETPHIAARRAK